ncbi:hypothetical protein [Dongia deserti]|uniref:hypothetical protein n=1 Tax=Dongia deserti TaxID=2268030 RepID=UPI000E6464CB|nr:hypothetical protein [Dongia deserti]
MNRCALLLLSGAGLLLAGGTAQAGACTAEIMALQEQMARMPTIASSSPYSPDAGPAPLPPAHGPLPSPGETLGAAPGADAGGGREQAHAVPSGSAEAGSSPGSEPLPVPAARSGTLAQGGTVPPPAEIQPMDSDAIQAGQIGAAPDRATSADIDEAAKALARARAFDRAGDEAACLNEVNKAKNELGELRQQ